MTIDIQPQNTTAAPAEQRGTLAEVAKQFLRLGFVAYGGPAAHVAMMEEEFVRRRGWLTRERFLDLVGAVSLLPGPSSTELAIYLGQIRAGLTGLIVAGACFILPAAILVTALARAYLKFGTLPQVAGLLFGIKPVVVALIAQAAWNLGKTALRNVPLAALAIGVVLLAVAGINAVWLLIGAGILWMLLREGKRLAADSAALGAWVATGSGSAAGTLGTLPIFFYFLKIGAVLVGSGYVLLPVLRYDLVLKFHWLSDSQLLDAVAVSQATPGPFFTVATFIGFLLAGWKGATLATLGMFLPAFLYVGITSGLLPKLRKSPLAGAFLDGVNAAAVALMAYVGWQFGRAALINVPAVILALLSTVLVFRYKINSTWLVLGGAAAGILLRLSGWV
ncbi:MAG TPA: chromate efflux transporter [Candidatus Limnocylindrales bacterium]|nr:chromate efflux transporter [Candidatus Limnocylindrales bacterium]